MIVCIVQLFGWGLAVGLRAYDHWAGALLSGFANGALGLMVVSLEVAVLHATGRAGPPESGGYRRGT